MIYVISDIHGEYDSYRKLLDKIKFSDSDELYVLGDCIDRGPEPVKLLHDMMSRPNVYPIMGNHEYMAVSVLRRLLRTITEESLADTLDESFIQALMLWEEDGAASTISAIHALGYDERLDILDYLEEFSLYEEVSVNGRDFVLVHAGLDNFSPERDLDDYNLHEVIFNPIDYNKVYYPDKYIVTGHIPTVVKENNDGRVIMQNNHIALDCGKVFGGRLAAVCLDTLDVFYDD